MTLRAAIALCISASLWNNGNGEMVAKCPEGWKARPNSGQCFQVHSYGTLRTFSDARSYCKSHGGDLIKLETRDLVNWILQEVAATGLIGEHSHMWVGAKELNGTFVWVENHHAINHTILPWDGSGSGKCAALTTESTLLKQPCSKMLHFICHRPINIPPPCDYENRWEEMSDFCFKKSTHETSWHDAQVECEIEGANLACIQESAEQQYATDFALEIHDQVWIGLTEEDHPGEFKWVDDCESLFTHWGPDQPDLSFKGYGSAAVDHDNNNGTWVVEKVTNNHHYLCKKPQGACVYGWQQFEQSCYYFNTEKSDNLVWQDAFDKCEAVGADLVVLDDEDEDAFLRNQIPMTDTIWLGLYSVPSDTLYWTDDTTMDSHNFTHMTEENIADALRAKDRMCAFFQVNDEKAKSSWIPIDCEEPRHYACEAPVGQPLHYIPPHEERYCPEDWRKNNDYCYYFATEEKTWAEAKDICRNHGGDLASIHTWDEQDFLKTYQTLDSAWIGFNDRASEKHWVWTDGTGVTITNWNYGEPDNEYGNENCAQMIIHNNGRWRDASCDMINTFICKMPASPDPFGTTEPSTTKEPDYSNCGWDWTENPVSGECYRLEMEELSFEDASINCHSLGKGHDGSVIELASLTTAQEQSFVEDMIFRERLSQTSLWIGMRNDFDGNYWLDKTPVTVFNWDKYQPSGYNTDDCVEMFTGTGKWNDYSCNKRNIFICEKKGPEYKGIQPPPPPEVLCPDGWSRYNNYCYYFSSDEVTWEEANSWCESNINSKLASIANDAENDFINKFASSTYSNVWLGLHDDNHGNDWHWTDGTVLREYTQWAPGQPDNDGGIEHCGQTSMTGDGWSDVPCSTSNLFVCKITAKTCPQGWNYHNEKCYYTSTFEEPFHAAREKCKEFNTEADLVSIHSYPEDLYFDQELTQSSDGTWIGLVYDNESQSWSWTDGQVNDYTNWNKGEPNFLEEEWCAEVIDSPVDSSHGKWNSLACSEARAYGCEFFPSHTTGCEKDWKRFGDYCYWHSKTWSIRYSDSFEDAIASCQAKGAHLSSIHSAEENDFIYSLVQYDDEDVWIGLSDEGRGGEFKWADGTPVSFTKWDGLQYLLLYPPSKCAMIPHTSRTSVWGIADCDLHNYYVCKKPVQAEPINPVDTGCKEGDIAYRSSCYSFSEESVSWHDARDACAVENAHLVTINDRFESAFISAYLGETGAWQWIGMNGTVAGDGAVTFNWVTGEPVEFTNWDEFEPDPVHGTCVLASGKSSTTGLWIVADCSETRRFLCEYDREGYAPSTPSPTPPPGPDCAADWEHVGDTCYKVHQEPRSWGEAESFCVSYGAHLTSINSEEEEALIKNLTGMSQVDSSFLSVWVGLQQGSDSGYHWTDGSAFSYVNWADGQPDSQYKRETCGSADKTSLELSLSNCQGYLPYICEAPQGTMISTLPPPTTGPVVKCDDDPSWYLFDNHCYKFVTESQEDPQTWWRSHEMCRRAGGELASVHTIEENYWLESMMTRISDDALWIGGRAKFDSGYEWIDGSPFDFDNWALGEPNNYLDQEDCISLYTHRLGNWNDQNCAHLKGRICKRVHGSTLPPPSTTPIPDGHCPEGWTHTGSKCLKLFNEPASNNDARNACKALHSNSDLVSIHSKQEQAHVMAALGLLAKNAWLGLRQDREFVWYDQTPVTFTNWASGQPDGQGLEGYCVEAYSHSGQWNDINCDYKKPYICQLNQDPDIHEDGPPLRCETPFDNYISYRGSCYRAVSTEMTWQEAEKICQNDGSHLVSTHDLAENALAWTLSQNMGFKSIWIGFNNIQDNKVFKWSDGWPSFFTNWAKNQPDMSATNQTCVRLDVKNGLWYTTSCDESRSFVCKFKDGAVPTPDPPVTGYCPDERWLDLGGAYCYLIVKDTKSWNEANMKCVKENSNLASIHSEDEMKLLLMAIKDSGNPVWIGLIQKIDGFGWSDGSGLDFVNWDDGEPSSDEEQCAQVDPGQGTWNDADCLSVLQSVCKKPKTRIPEPTNPTLPPRPGTTTHPPDGGSGLSSSAIFGIVISALVIIAGVGFIGLTFVNKKRGRENYAPFTASFGGQSASSVNIATLDTTDA